MAEGGSNGRSAWVDAIMTLVAQSEDAEVEEAEVVSEEPLDEGGEEGEETG